MQIVLREVVALGGAIAADLRLKREVIEGADDLAFELFRPGHTRVVDRQLEGGLVAGHAAQGPQGFLLRGGERGERRCCLLIHRTGLDLPFQLRDIVRECCQYDALEIHRRLLYAVIRSS